MSSVMNGEFERYLCVIHESSSSVTWPDLNISHPAWAIIAPLSMQNLSQIDTVLLDGGGAIRVGHLLGRMVTARLWQTA